MSERIDIGDALRIRDANDEWLDAVAVGTPEGQWVDGCKVHDFPVVKVRVMGVDQDVPWPLSDVEKVR